MGLETRGYPLSVNEFLHQLKSNQVAILSVDMLIATSLLLMTLEKSHDLQIWQSRDQ